MSIFDTYKTSKDLETRGISFTPDSSTIITLARAGGQNKKFQKVIDRLSKPFRHQIRKGTLDAELDRKITAEAFAEAVVLNWETIVGETAHVGIMADPSNPSGYDSEPNEHGLVPVTKHNIMRTFKLLPDLLNDCMEQSQLVSNFQQTEGDAGN